MWRTMYQVTARAFVADIAARCPQKNCSSRAQDELMTAQLHTSKEHLIFSSADGTNLCKTDRCYSS